MRFFFPVQALPVVLSASDESRTISIPGDFNIGSSSLIPEIANSLRIPSAEAE